MDCWEGEAEAGFKSKEGLKLEITAENAGKIRVILQSQIGL